MLNPFLNNCIWNERNCAKYKQKVKVVQDENFYEKFLDNEILLKTGVKKLNKIQIYECKKCNCYQNSPWITNDLSRHFYSNVYGQHHKGWSNILNYKDKKILSNSYIFEKVISKLNVKKYAEYNCPFTGVFLNFFLKNTIIKHVYFKKIFQIIHKLNSKKQNASNSKKHILKNNLDAFKLAKKYNDFYLKYLKKKNKKVEKTLLLDSSPIMWGQNCNYKSINCKTLSKLLFGINHSTISEAKRNKNKYDLFGFYLTLDHSSKPWDVLKYALDNSEVVLIYNHVFPDFGKQHYFTLSNNFEYFLKSKKINSINLKPILQNKDRNIKIDNNKILLLCSKNEKKIKKIQKIFS